MADTFDIRIGKFKASSETTYSTTQVSRYKVTLQGKYFTLEQTAFKQVCKVEDKRSQ